MTCPWVGFSPSLRRIGEPQTEPALAADDTPGVGGSLRGCLGAILPSPDPCLAMRAAILHVIVHVPTYMHAHVYVHTHCTTHACMYTDAHMQAHIGHMCLCTHILHTQSAHTQIHTLTQVHIRTPYVCTDICTQHIHNPCTHKCMHTHKHALKHAHAHTHLHARMYTRVYTCTRTHTGFIGQEV